MQLANGRSVLQKERGFAKLSAYPRDLVTRHWLLLCFLTLSASIHTRWPAQKPLVPGEAKSRSSLSLGAKRQLAWLRPESQARLYWKIDRA